jgi:hypothetical protein
VAFGIAMDMMHWAMRFVSYWHIRKAFKMGATEEHFDAIFNFVIDNNHS